MLGILLLIVGFGLVVSCAAWRPAPARVWVWWTGLCAAICAFAAGCALWQIDATLYGMDVFARWGGRSVVALAVVFVAWMYVGRRARKREGRRGWGWMRTAAAMVALGAMLASAWVVGSIPWIRRDGWWAAVPTTVLIVGMDVLPEVAERELLWRMPGQRMRQLIQMNRGEVWGWQVSVARARLWRRVGDAPTAESIGAAEALSEVLADSTARTAMFDLAFRGLVAGDPATRRRAALIMPRRFDRASGNWHLERRAALDRLMPELLPRLIGILDDPDTEAQMGAVRALGLVGPPAAAAVPRLMQMLRESDKSLDGYEIVETLRALNADMQPLFAELQDGLRSNDRRQRIAALQRLGRSWFLRSDGDLSIMLLQRIREGDDEESLLAAEVARRGADTTAIMTELKEEAKRRPESRDKYFALMNEGALFDLGPSALSGVFHSDDAWLQSRVFGVLKQHLNNASGDPRHAEAVSVLAAAAKDHPNPAIRAAAAEAVAPFKGEAGIE